MAHLITKPYREVNMHLSIVLINISNNPKVVIMSFKQAPYPPLGT